MDTKNTLKVCLLVFSIFIVLAEAEKLHELENDLPELEADKASIYQQQFLVINKDLVDATESTDPEENFKLIEEIRGDAPNWLDALSFSKDAIKLFTSLPRSLDDCDYKSYQVLIRNYIAAEGRSHVDGGLRRVDGIVHHYALEHAKKCRPLYADSFKQFQSSVDPKVYHHVTEMFAELPESDLVKFAYLDYDGNADIITTGLKGININTKNCIKLLETLERLIEDPAAKRLLYAQTDEINGGYMMSAKFQKNIYEEYIEKPCQEYLAMSRNVFAPARFDAAIEDGAQKELLHPADDTFKHAWISHRLCQYMIKLPPMELIEKVIINRVPSASN